ncbi:hypothetical protein L1887_30847 [Cichorium endivia]|nr:hypothetical protein L1887_30847 [Cichorium endivia]
MSGGSATGAPISGRRSTVRVVVVGDCGTGKSSLIAAAASENFPENVSPFLPPTHLPACLKGKAKLEEELKRADAVVLTYACDKPETLNCLQKFSIPEFCRLKVKVPVIVVGCKQGLRDEHCPISSLDQVRTPIMRQLREMEAYIECSATNLAWVGNVFHYALNAVLHPRGLLADQQS